MKKTTYIIIAVLLCGGFFEITITKAIISDDIFLVIQWIWAIFGLFYFQKNANNPLNTIQNKSILYFFFFGIVLSMFSALAYHDQSLINTAISQRPLYNFVYLFVFLRMKPTEKELMSGLRVGAIFTIGYFILSIYMPQSFVNDDLLERRIEAENMDIGYVQTGMLITLLYFFYLVNKFLKKNSLKLFLFVSIIFLYFILLQNRSVLLLVLPIYLYTLFKIKGLKKIWIYLFAVVVFYFVSPVLTTIFNNLMEETILQMEDPNYNRWQAIEFFVFEFNEGNIVRQLFGNGKPTFVGDYITKLGRAVSERGAYVSDIGLIGNWFLYGVIPVLIIIIIGCKVILRRRFSIYLKMFTVHLFFVPTIFSFDSMSGAFLFSIYFYLYLYYNTYAKKSKARSFRYNS